MYQYIFQIMLFKRKLCNKNNLMNLAWKNLQVRIKDIRLVIAYTVVNEKVYVQRRKYWHSQTIELIWTCIYFVYPLYKWIRIFYLPMNHHGISTSMWCIYKYDGSERSGCYYIYIFKWAVNCHQMILSYQK